MTEEKDLATRIREGYEPTLGDYLELEEKKMQEQATLAEQQGLRWKKASLLRTVAQIRYYISDEARVAPIASYTPETIQSLVELALKRGATVATPLLHILRCCFRKAYQDEAIDLNPMNSLRYQRKRSEDNLLRKEEFERIVPLFFQEPGGVFVGLCAYLDISFESGSHISLKDVDEENHVILCYRNGQKSIKEVILYDETAIQLLQRAIEDYEKRMANPAAAKNNPEHILFIAKNGKPYTSRQQDAIALRLREASGTPRCHLPALREYLRSNCL